jgi:hypothetical protein
MADCGVDDMCQTVNIQRDGHYNTDVRRLTTGIRFEKCVVVRTS